MPKPFGGKKAPAFGKGGSKKGGKSGGVAKGKKMAKPAPKKGK